jgi:hypothetical protein
MNSLRAEDTAVCCCTTGTVVTSVWAQT